MGVVATIIFFLSLLGLVGLFVLKSWELHRATILAPQLRRRADLHALELKTHLMNARGEAAKIIPFLTLLGRYFIHEGALAFASAAHVAGAQANRLADFVSHKHRFERQAPRSEFLKQVSERPTQITPSVPLTKKTRRVPKKKPAPSELEIIG